MEEVFYRVLSIDGDYAQLQSVNSEGKPGETVPVALALLPENLEEGSLLKRIFFDYELVE